MSVRASLMVTCLGDALFPRVGVAAVHVLEGLGVNLDFPAGQTCCGQPAFNSGYRDSARRSARAVLRAAGYEEQFLHSTGHGVGLEIHEPPWLRRGNEDPLRVGDVVTVEPGVYLPGVGGVRLEDMVLVTEAGPEVLTGSLRELVRP